MGEYLAQRYMRFCFLERPDEDVRICKESVGTYQELEDFFFRAGNKKRSNFDLHIHCEKECSGRNEVREADYEERLRISGVFFKWELVHFVCFIPKRPYVLPAPGHSLPDLKSDEDLFLLFIPSPDISEVSSIFENGLQLPKRQIRLAFRHHWGVEHVRRLSQLDFEVLDKELSKGIGKLLTNLTSGKNKDERGKIVFIVIRYFLNSYQIGPDGIKRI
ncbi:hypothetical protein B0J12DRAFT_660014 [Macrophomina phaseolina]|uniref:Uncharacterized protein n=1 Tax=Macrophomina phaseolina TaxID=35725 RepID=A0ABQ8GHG6_9PEZI|nr:hypothetical protein B0J12DRAFT_660014 [Macrophomina phaseolina]